MNTDDTVAHVAEAMLSRVIPRFYAFDIGHVAIQFQAVACHVNVQCRTVPGPVSISAAGRYRAVAVLDEPPSDAVVEPFDDGVRRSRSPSGTASRCRLPTASTVAFAENLAGVLVGGIRARRRPFRVQRQSAAKFPAHLQGHAVAGNAVDAAPIAVEFHRVVGPCGGWSRCRAWCRDGWR